MGSRTVKSYSDRGSLKELVRRHEDEVPFTSSELRIKKLYDYATANSDTAVLDSLGFITTDYIHDKNALPLSAYRLRKIVADISSRSGNKVLEMKTELDNCFLRNENHCLAVLQAESRQRQSLIKIASDIKYKRSFRRVS